MPATSRNTRRYGPFQQKIAEHPSEQIYENRSKVVVINLFRLETG
jgi:hypothetical protein